MSKNIDKRVKKTKIAIKEAFVELLSVKKYDQITIKDISDVADISRKTFYNNYNGVHDLINEMKEEIIEVLKYNIESLDFKKDIYTPNIIFEKIGAALQGEYEIYGKLLANKLNFELIVHFINSILLVLKDAFAKSFNIKLSKEEIEVFLNYTTNGVVAVYQNWYNSDHKLPLEVIRNVLEKTIFNGLIGLINTKSRNIF